MTPKQNLVLSVYGYHQRRGEPTPTYEAIAKALGWKSKSTVAHIVYILENDGHLVRLPDRACAVAVTPESMKFCKAVFDTPQGAFFAPAKRTNHRGNTIFT